MAVFCEEIKNAAPADLMQMGLTGREAEILF